MNHNQYLQQIAGSSDYVVELQKEISEVQEKLAELSDLSKTALGAIERGTSSPSIDTLDRIAAALEIELSELVKVKSVDL